MGPCLSSSGKAMAETGTIEVIVNESFPSIPAYEMFATLSRWDAAYFPDGAPKCIELIPSLYSGKNDSPVAAGCKRKMKMGESSFVALLESIDKNGMTFSYRPGVDGTVFPVPSTNIRGTVTVISNKAGCKVNYTTTMDLMPNAPAGFPDHYKSIISGVVQSAAAFAQNQMKVDLHRPDGATSVIVDESFPDLSAKQMWTSIGRWDAAYFPDDAPKCIGTWGTGPGARRQMKMGDHHFVALLQSVDDAHMTFTYCPGVDGTVFPVPCSNVKGTVTVIPDGPGCKVLYVTKMDLALDAPAGFTAHYKSIITAVVNGAAEFAKAS